MIALDQMPKTYQTQYGRTVRKLVKEVREQIAAGECTDTDWIVTYDLYDTTREEADARFHITDYDGDAYDRVLDWRSHVEHEVIRQIADLTAPEEPAMDDLTIHDPADCPYCGGEGYVDTRHPELDDIVMAEVWMPDPCVCPAGQEWEERQADPDYDPEP